VTHDDTTTAVMPSSPNLLEPPGGRRNFSLRLPEALFEQLRTLSERRGESMNNLVGAAVATLVDRPDIAPSPLAGDIGPQIARDGVRMGPEAIGPLKGIAKHASNRGQIALASVVWAAAARLILEQDGPEQASLELSHSAAVADSANHFELAVALYEEALRVDPNNLEAVSRLGQRLHHLAQQNDDLERYREAERHLARVTFLDNHAKLFHGWSQLFVARAEQDRYREEQAVAEVEEALKSWAFGEPSGQERLSWLRQLRRLYSAGLGGRAKALVEFANRNARWGAIDDVEVMRGA
jgi:tetratricopeptide (TPR) repeat protein